MEISQGHSSFDTIKSHISETFGDVMSKHYLRKQGGSVVVTLPSKILEDLDLSNGDVVDIVRDGQKICITKSFQTKRYGKYSLSELLDGYQADVNDREKDEFIKAPDVGLEVIHD